MRVYKDNSGIKIQAGQVIRCGKNSILRVVRRNQKLFAVSVDEKNKSIPLQTLCLGKSICKNINIITKKPL